MSPDFIPECVDGAAYGFFEQRFEFGEKHFNRIEVGRVRGQIADACADGFDGLSHVGALVTAEIVGDDDIAWLQGGAEDLAYIDKKCLLIHRAVERHRRGDFVHAQPGDERRGVPVTARNGSMAPLAFRRTPARAGHMSVRASFVDEHQLAYIKRGLVVLPLGPFLFHVCSCLLAGAQSFF